MRRIIRRGFLVFITQELPDDRAERILQPSASHINIPDNTYLTLHEAPLLREPPFGFHPPAPGGDLPVHPAFRRPQVVISEII